MCLRFLTPPGRLLLPGLGMMLDLQVRIVLAPQTFPVGAIRAADDQRPQLSFGASVQLVDFKFDQLPLPRSAVTRSGGFPFGDVEENVLAVIFGFDEAEFAPFVHVSDAPETPTWDDERLLIIGHIS